MFRKKSSWVARDQAYIDFSSGPGKSRVRTGQTDRHIARQPIDHFQSPVKLPCFRGQTNRGAFLDGEPLSTALNSQLFVLVVPIFLQVGSAGSNVDLVTGKSMLAKRLPIIPPQLTLEEALETTKIHSTVGLLAPGKALVTRRPFRTPHHTVEGWNARRQ